MPNSVTLLMVGVGLAAKGRKMSAMLMSFQAARCAGAVKRGRSYTFAGRVTVA